MSAFGPKQTWAAAPHGGLPWRLRAVGGVTCGSGEWCRRHGDWHGNGRQAVTTVMSAVGPKRTSAFTLHMSAFDQSGHLPKIKISVQALRASLSPPMNIPYGSLNC